MGCENSLCSTTTFKKEVKWYTNEVNSLIWSGAFCKLVDICVSFTVKCLVVYFIHHYVLCIFSCWFLTNTSLVICVAHNLSNCCLSFHFTFSRVSFNYCINVFLWTSNFEEILWIEVLVCSSKGFKVLLVHLSPFRLEFIFANCVGFGSKLFCLYGCEIRRVFFSVFSLSHVIAIHTQSVLGLSILFRWSIVSPDTTSSSDVFTSWYLAEYILSPSSFSVWTSWIYLEVCSYVQIFKSACQGPYKTRDFQWNVNEWIGNLWITDTCVMLSFLSTKLFYLSIYLCLV